MKKIMDKFSSFKLKGRIFTFTVLQLIDPDVLTLSDQLKTLIAQAPQFLKNIPIILDCSQCEDKELNLEEIYQCLKKFEIIPIAIQTQSEMITASATSLNLVVVHLWCEPGSNRRHKDFQSFALPTELPHHP